MIFIVTYAVTCFKLTWARYSKWGILIGLCLSSVRAYASQSVRQPLLTKLLLGNNWVKFNETFLEASFGDPPQKYNNASLLTNNNNMFCLKEYLLLKNISITSGPNIMKLHQKLSWVTLYKNTKVAMHQQQQQQQIGLFPVWL